MVLRHASEKFRLAYELPLDTNELFGTFNQFDNVSADKLEENSYRSDLLAKTDLWKKTNSINQLIDYQNLNETFYENDLDENLIPDYNEEDNLQSPVIYQWHREKIYHNSIKIIINHLDYLLIFFDHMLIFSKKNIVVEQVSSSPRPIKSTKIPRSRWDDRVLY
jgi:uncharacterized protein YktA (UPF0223 family)